MKPKQLNHRSRENPQKRTLEQEERLYIQSVLNELADHFHEWKDAFLDDPYGLMEFAYYEGCGDTECCGDTLCKAAPFALGTYLVSDHGCGWVMVMTNSGWHYAIDHAALERPIDLLSLESKDYYRKDPDDFHEHISRGEATTYSAEAIVELIKLKLESE